MGITRYIEQEAPRRSSTQPQGETEFQLIQHFFFAFIHFIFVVLEAGIQEKIFLVCENATLSSFIFSQLQ